MDNTITHRLPFRQELTEYNGDLTPRFVFETLMYIIFRKSARKFYTEVKEACNIKETEFNRCMNCRKPIMDHLRFCDQEGFIVSEDLHFLSKCEYEFFVKHKDILLESITG